MVNQNNYLVHFGIPRRSGRYPWGSGKEPYQGDGPIERSSRPAPKNESEARTAAAKKTSSESSSENNRPQRKRDVSEYSDAELQRFLNRVNMEQKYQSIIAPPQTFKDRVIKDLKDIAYNSVKDTLKNVATAQMTKAANGLIDAQGAKAKAKKAAG